MDGILALWKERGMTSHDCVFKLRKILRTKKVGHGGTLDPDVDGVLPIFIGKGTKLMEFLQEQGKTYRGTVTLGYTTTTEDASGERLVEQKLTETPALETIDQMMATFLGTIQQTPPMYSAVKVKGRRLYEYARAGETVERPTRETTIYAFKRVSEVIFDQALGTASWDFEVTCSKGTYVRTLAVDLGEALGYPAHMQELTRISSGGFGVGDCLTLAQVAEKMAEANEEGTDPTFLFPIERAVAEMARIDLSDEAYDRARNGVVFAQDELPFPQGAERVALFYHQQLVSIYQVHPSKKDSFKPLKVLRNAEREC